MPVDKYKNSVKNTTIPNTNFNAYVLLTRLSEEEIDRLTGRNQNDQSVHNSHVCIVNIKQEYPDNVNSENYGNMVENNTWLSQECSTIVKIETSTTEIREIKTEPLEDYEENIENPQFSNCNKNIDNTFNCDLCYEVFDDFEMLFIHKSVYHQNKPYACEFCDERFSLSLHLNIHIAEHVNDFCKSRRAPTDIQSSSRSNLAGNYNNCRSMTLLQNSLTNHPKNLQNKKNSKEKKCSEKNVSVVSTRQYCASNSNSFSQNNRVCKPFKCPNCLFSSTSENKFLNHHKVCNPDFGSSYTPENDLIHCQLCDKTFLNQASLNGHMKYHSIRGEIISRRNNKNNKLNSISKSQNYINVQKSVAPKAYTCKECNRNFISVRKLNIHYKQHKKLMVCTICHKQFFFKKSFEKHLLIHETITVKKNNGKNTSFNKDNLLNNSQSTKRNSLKIKFSSNKITNDKKQQKIHLKNVESFHCVYCDKNYKNIKSLAEHKRRYHGNAKPKVKRLASIKCDWCNAVITKCNLIRHINSFHPNVKPIKCTSCSKKFKNHSSLKSHMYNDHKN